VGRKQCELDQVSVYTKTYNVAVVGGGPAGSAAAVSAARLGARVLLIEQQGFLGGLLTGAMVTPMLGGHINEGFYSELTARLKKHGAIFEPAYGEGQNPEYLKLILEEMCVEANVELLYYTSCIGASVDDNVVTGVRIANKSGIQDIGDGVVIDCSGDGDVACLAGAQFQKGDSSGTLMPVTIRFILGNVDIEKAVAFNRRYQKQFPTDIPCANLTCPQIALSAFETLIERAKENGEIHSEDWAYAGFAVPGRPGELVFNNPYVTGIDGTNAEDLTRAQVEGRKYVFEIADFFRKYVDGCQDSYVVSVAPMVGVRETRAIIGDYVITADDVLQGASFDDAIARNTYCIDLHSADGGRGDETESGINIQDPTKPGGVPYRCLLPKGLENILVAGRCISGTRDANSALRVSANCMAFGQAAGVAAAMAVKGQITPRQIDVKELQKTLRAQGVAL
jgi:hypothetical protein